MAKAVSFASLSFDLRNNINKPTTPYPYATVSDISGAFSFVIEVNYDFEYKGKLSAKANYFID